MEFCTVSVLLGGSPAHVVTGKIVSVPEIRLLQTIHGEDAVTDIVPHENRATTSDAERERLKLAYEPSQVEEQRNIVSRVFGPMGPLPQRLIDIGIDPHAEAASMKQRAQELIAAADKLENEDDPNTLQDDEVNFGEEPDLAFDDTAPLKN